MTRPHVLMSIIDARTFCIDKDFDTTGLTDDEIINMAMAVLLEEKHASQPIPQPIPAHNPTADDLALELMNNGKAGFTRALNTYIEQNTKTVKTVGATMYVKVDKDGNPLDGNKLESQYQEPTFKQAHEIWPELPQSESQYTFPCSDFNFEGQPDYEISHVHNSYILPAIASAMRRDQNVWLYGHKGTGKTTLVEHLAHKLNRPFTRISHSQFTDALELQGGMGMRDGTTYWQDGALTKAIRIPHNIILIDEPSKSPTASDEYQTLLDQRKLTLSSGEVVHVAPNVFFICADNHDGTGLGNELYIGTAPMNTAFLDRFVAKLELHYMPVEAEAKLLEPYLTKQSARDLAEFAERIRKALQLGSVKDPISLRRLIAIATAIQDGLPQAFVLESCLYAHIDDMDREYYKQEVSTHLNSNLKGA